MLYAKVSTRKVAMQIGVPNSTVLFYLLIMPIPSSSGIGWLS
jgi:hypothetical protein